jgi:hypothetical protein
VGQYYYVINLDKCEYLHPHKFGDGLKLLEFGCSTPGTLTALAVLLADGNGRGGGDLNSTHPLIGSWAGDRIIVAGDYADKIPGTETNYFHLAEQTFTDISAEMVQVLCKDPWIAQDLKPKLAYFQ